DPTAATMAVGTSSVQTPLQLPSLRRTRRALTMQRPSAIINGIPKRHHPTGDVNEDKGSGQRRATASAPS
ncbi:MAG TPA: hypothetical protein VJV97_04635, partial [Gemmatimonadaceae bacterium]|nr:hypothetical protein [Gemmatimonadaceae bacterium]